jgi:hypothetical protein
VADVCTFCGSAAADRAFLAEAKAASAAICNVCLAVCFRQLEYKKGLVPSPGVAHMIGGIEMWPGERRLRQVDHAVREGRRVLRGKLRGLLRGRAPANAATDAATDGRSRSRPTAPLASMFVQHVHPLATFEHRCAMCGAREQLVPSPKGARICEPCIESWTRTLLG